MQRLAIKKTLDHTVHTMLLTTLIIVLAGMLTLHTYAEAEDPGAQEIQSDIQAEEMAEQEVPQQEEENLEPEPILPDNSEQDPGESLPEEEEPAVQDGWHIDGTDRYYIENGEYIKNNPHKEIDGVWYRFDEEGRAFEANIYTAGDTPFGTGDRVWFYNVSGGSFGSDMILVESGGRFGLIDAGNRYAETIEDADGTVYDAPYNKELSSQMEGKNGRDGMTYMIKTLGVEHLDFIIGTHAHSDHIGGIPEIAALQAYGKDGLFHYLVDESTIFLYKEYKHISDREDDLGEERPDSWHNQAFWYQAVNAVEERGGTVVDLSNGLSADEGDSINVDYAAALQAIEATHVFDSVSFESRSATSPFDDRVSCLWGNIKLDFYNLFSRRDTAGGENANSIVTVITVGGQKAYLGGDINTFNRTEQKIAEVIAQDHGRIALVKASHHGYNYSNSRDLVDLLQPEIYVTPGSRTSGEGAASDSHRVLKYYADANYGTRFYEIGAAERALVIEFDEKTLRVWAVVGEGSEASFGSTDNCQESPVPADGWAIWVQEFGDHSETNWYYFENGHPATGWWFIGGEWYYFAESGILATDRWQKDSVGWCWLGSDGAVVRNKWIKDDSDWYFLNSAGYMTANEWVKDSCGWCYLAATGKMLTNNWARDSIGWCWLSEAGYIVYDRWINDGGSWYYLKPNGYMAVNEWAKDSSGWCYLAATGKMLMNGWAKDSIGWCWLSEAGYVVYDRWVNDRGAWYYLKPDGYMAVGNVSIGGRLYRFATSGVWMN